MSESVQLPETVDLVVKSDRTYCKWYGGIVRACIAVNEGKIVALGSESKMPKADMVIDATGQKMVVAPGMIDTHVHCRDPGFTNKEDYTTATSAAAAGGITTIFDMCNVKPVPNTLETYSQHNKNAESKAIVDFGHNASGTILDEIPKIAKAGAATLKIFMLIDVARDYPHMPGTGIRDEGHMFLCAKEIAKTGLPMIVHVNNQPVYEQISKEFIDREEADAQGYARAGESYENLPVLLGVSTCLWMQYATGVKLHVLHVAKAESWDMIRSALARGQDVTAEINPASLFFQSYWKNIVRYGPYSQGHWTRPEDSEANWAAINSALGRGTIIIGSDHAPHAKSEKEIGWWNDFEAPGGRPIIQEYVPLLLNEVNNMRLSLERMIQVCSENPAKRWNVFPRKGCLEIGSDGDLAILDLKKKHKFTVEEMRSKCGYTCFEGVEVTGFPVKTIVRGNVVCDEGEILVKPGFGKFQRPLTNTVMT